MGNLKLEFPYFLIIIIGQIAIIKKDPAIQVRTRRRL